MGGQSLCNKTLLRPPTESEIPESCLSIAQIISEKSFLFWGGMIRAGVVTQGIFAGW
jgi:hypothetical protein